MELDDKNITAALGELKIQRLKLDIAINSLQEIRGEIKPKKLDLKIDVSEIVKFCIGHFKIDLAENNRTTPYKWARFFYFILCKTYTRSSLEKIGNEVNLNHATVINGLKRHQEMLDYKDEDYLRYIETAEECFTTHLLTLSNKN